MLWAIICWKTLGQAVHFDVNLTRSTYLNLQTWPHPFMTMMFPGGSGHFQYDNAPCHTAHIVQEWFKEHDKEFKVFTWLPNPQDLNPVKHLWDVLDQKVWLLHLTT